MQAAYLIHSFPRCGDVSRRQTPSPLLAVARDPAGPPSCGGVSSGRTKRSAMYQNITGWVNACLRLIWT